MPSRARSAMSASSARWARLYWFCTQTMGAIRRASAICVGVTAAKRQETRRHPHHRFAANLIGAERQLQRNYSYAGYNPVASFFLGLKQFFVGPGEQLRRGFSIFREAGQSGADRSPNLF